MAQNFPNNARGLTIAEDTQTIFQNFREAAGRQAGMVSRVKKVEKAQKKSGRRVWSKPVMRGGLRMYGGNFLIGFRRRGRQTVSKADVLRDIKRNNIRIVPRSTFYGYCRLLDARILARQMEFRPRPVVLRNNRVIPIPQNPANIALPMRVINAEIEAILPPDNRFNSLDPNYEKGANGADDSIVEDIYD